MFKIASALVALSALSLALAGSTRVVSSIEASVEVIMALVAMALMAVTAWWFWKHRLVTAELATYVTQGLTTVVCVGTLVIAVISSNDLSMGVAVLATLSATSMVSVGVDEVSEGVARHWRFYLSSVAYEVLMAFYLYLVW